MELSVENVRVDSIHNPHVICIWLAKSKMDQIREGAAIHIPRMEDDLCPVAAS